MRHINKIFIHCSATPEGRDVKTEEIRRWHLNKGWRDIGYHYVIELDGSLHTGRKVEQMGAGVEGHNKHSIHICYVGGLTQNGKAKDTRTELQQLTMVNVLNHLKEEYPNATIHGHNEFANKACPSFDVQAEYGYLNEL